MSLPELSAVSTVINSKGHTCNLLVFELSHESLLWRSVNLKGRTVFVDENSYAVSKSEQNNLGVEAYDVVYSTKVSQVGSKMVVLERLNDFVDELAVRRGVPSKPVAIETLAIEHRRLVVSARFALLLLRFLLVRVSGDVAVPLVIK